MTPRDPTQKLVDRLAHIASQESPLIPRMQAWLEGGSPVTAKDFLVLSNHPRREPGTFDAVNLINHTMAREAFTALFGFAAIVWETIDDILPHGPFIEVGAGTGYLARLLATRGADVLATDTLDADYGFMCGKWFDVVKMEAVEAVSRNPDRTVIMSWPCMGEDWSAQVLDTMVLGQKVLHIGEGRRGCTGCLRLYDVLDEQFETLTCPRLPRFNGIHDQATIYRRR